MATEYVKTIECPKCRYRNVAGTKFCGDCGTALAGSPVACGKCGTENPPDAKFCPNCGNNLQNHEENDPDIRHLQDALRGDYVVQKSLGEGRFGRVFLAEHTGLGQKRVIKLLSADSSRSKDIRNRFFQEAQLLARLKHPNIVTIMDVKEYNGRPYYIMSYIEGGSLADLLLKEKKLSTVRAITIVGKLLSALSEVHGKGIIHRDIKPDNVLLELSGEPILIDFGIARIEEGSKAKTGTGFSIGTPVYMSPEQLDAKPINLTTDIYSMGIMLFELLTGKPPYEGSMSSLINQHNSAKLPSVSGKIEEFHLADGIQAVLQKACAKEPSARYGSAMEMREAVEDVVQRPKGILIEPREVETILVPAPIIETQKEEWEIKYEKKMEELQKKEDELKNREKIVVQKKKAEPQKQKIPKTYTNSLGMEFILIPAGEFMMGAVPQINESYVNEKPKHKVRITKPFYIGKYPVTQEEWEKLTGNNPSNFKNAGKKAPVEQVSWNDCIEYIKKLNKMENGILSIFKSDKYRLPTEAEWEYAAQAGGSDRIYSFGDDILKLGDYAWYVKNSGKTTHPVGEKKPNAWELYDMMGNVWEWCDDWYNGKYYKDSPMDDPKGVGWGERHVLRGGSWSSDARRCRLSYRGCSDPTNAYDHYGLRIVYLP